MFTIGYDIGSSSVKASLTDLQTGACIATAFYPKTEAPIKAVHPGWAEQNPDDWWQYLKDATHDILAQSNVDKQAICAIGVSYQMHGLVCVDKKMRPLRDAIIWCDSRAVPYGQKAFDALGHEYCLSRLLNSPGNFTASKLAWVRENEPDVFSQIYKVMLPGDYIVARMTGEATTTVSGLSEGMMWDFSDNTPAQFLLDYFGIPAEMLAAIVPTFGIQGELLPSIAEELGLKAGAPITYRAGDQPNNALSLGVLNPGEAATTAGTSGVVYGVLDKVTYDPQSRVNTFAHVNHDGNSTRLGVLLCINGTGILNSWMHRYVAPELSYSEMNDLAAQAPVGSEGLSVMPFGNGAERMLNNREVGAAVRGMDFNRHTRAHLLRASQEGIVFAFAYGMEVMKEMGLSLSTIRAGRANMFLSPIFRQTLAAVTGATIELCDTDGSVGAARGAGFGIGAYTSLHEAFASLRRTDIIMPPADTAAYRDAYQRWRNYLNN